MAEEKQTLSYIMVALLIINTLFLGGIFMKLNCGSGLCPMTKKGSAMCPLSKGSQAGSAKGSMDGSMKGSQ